VAERGRDRPGELSHLLSPQRSAGAETDDASAMTTKTAMTFPTLPLTAARTAAHARGATASGDAGQRLLGQRVLIVEDEALLALELQYAFEDEGAEVIGPAMSLDHALTFAAGAEIDLAVLDVDLAGREVYPVASLLRKRGVPFVFHTGHGSRSELAAMFPGAITCTKPTMPDMLVLQLTRLGMA